jgi:hypothetical protein
MPPNGGHQPRPEAGAERTLEGGRLDAVVRPRCASAPRQPGALRPLSQLPTARALLAGCGGDLRRAIGAPPGCDRDVTQALRAFAGRLGLRLRRPQAHQ